MALCNPHSERDWDFYLGNSGDDSSLPAGTKIPEGVKVPACNWRILNNGTDPLPPHLEAEMVAWEAFVAEQKQTAKAQEQKRLRGSASYNQNEGVISLKLTPAEQERLEEQKRSALEYLQKRMQSQLPPPVVPASYAAIVARRC
jgi:hypothetical protein